MDGRSLSDFQCGAPPEEDIADPVYCRCLILPLKKNSAAMVWPKYVPLQAYGRTTVQGSPFRVRCQPPRADPENSSVTLLQEHAFIDDTVKAAIRTIDQFGEMCTADGALVAQILDAQTEKVLFDAHLVETGMVRPRRSMLSCTMGASVSNFHLAVYLLRHHKSLL